MQLCLFGTVVFANQNESCALLSAAISHLEVAANNSELLWGIKAIVLHLHKLRLVSNFESVLEIVSKRLSSLEPCPEMREVILCFTKVCWTAGREDLTTNGILRLVLLAGADPYALLEVLELFWFWRRRGEELPGRAGSIAKGVAMTLDVSEIPGLSERASLILSEFT